MNFEQFTKYVEENIKDYLSPKYEDARVRIVDCHKTTKSESYKGINVALTDRKTNEPSPVVSLEGFYQEMQEKNIPVKELVKDIAGVIEEAATKEFNLDLSKKNILENLFTAAVNIKDANLDDKPYVQINDIAIVAKSEVDRNGNGVITITNHLAEELGLSPAEVMTMAMDNNAKFSRPVCQNMLTLLSDILDDDSDSPVAEEVEPEAYVLSNRRGMYGASFIADKEVLGAVARKLGENFAILPSSVHELIIVPDVKARMLPELKSIVENVNKTLVNSQGMFLSDNVYVYDAKEDMVAVYDGELKPEKIKGEAMKNPSVLFR